MNFEAKAHLIRKTKKNLKDALEIKTEKLELKQKE